MLDNQLPLSLVQADEGSGTSSANEDAPFRTGFGVVVVTSDDGNSKREMRYEANVLALLWGAPLREFC